MRIYFLLSLVLVSHLATAAIVNSTVKDEPVSVFIDENGKIYAYTVGNTRVFREKSANDEPTYCSDAYCYNDGKFYDKNDPKKKPLKGDQLASAKGELSANPYKITDDAMEKAWNDCEKDLNAEGCGWVKDFKDETWRELDTIVDNKIAQILNGYLDYVLGPFSYGVPAAICGDSLYVKDTKVQKDQFSGLPIPVNEYESEMERKLREDIRTVILEGEKAQLSDTQYRYAVNVKLIGDKGVDWKLYLFNSCTNEESAEIETGRLSAREYYGMVFADDSMVFDCSVKRPCRFNQACIRMSDEESSRCVSLVHGTGFFQGDC